MDTRRHATAKGDLCDITYGGTRVSRSSASKVVFALLAVAALVMNISSVATAQGTEPDPPRFLPAVNSPVGNNPTGVDTGDFDEDGTPDLVVANYQSGQVSLLLGSGQGVFGPPDSYPVGSDPWGVVVADFNDDGNLDAAITDRGQNLVIVFEGSGEGYFNPPNYFGVAGTEPMGIEAADFDGDSDIDLVTANAVSDNISVLTNPGNGQFLNTAQTFPVGENPTSVAIGDIGGDGELDLAVSNQDTENISVLTGNGDGDFSAPANFPTHILANSSPGEVVSGDFDGDGDRDLAVPNQTRNSVSVLLNDGQGGFSEPANFNVGDFPFGMVTADVNHDDILDLAVLNRMSNDVSVLAGYGDGSFAAPVNFAVSRPSLAVAADFGGDSQPDLAVTSASGDAVSVLLNDFNVQPEAVNDFYNTDEDTTLNVSAANGVLKNDSDFNDDPFTATVTDNTEHGALSLNPTGSFSYVPDLNYNGPESFTYRICDNGVPVKCDEATVNLTVASVNDAPVAKDDSYGTNEDTQITVPAPGVLGNDTDVEEDVLTAILVTAPNHGELTLNPNGSFSYVPDPNYNGFDSFTYRASDGNGVSDEATVSLAVASVNDDPVAVNDSYGTDEDTPFNVSAANGVLKNDTDVDNDTLSASVVSAPDHGTLVLNADGSFTYTPNNNFNGSDSFTYRASDGNGGSDVATVSITVASDNDKPVASDDTANVDENESVDIDVLDNDNDPDGKTDLDRASVTVVTEPGSGTATANQNGTVTYTPDENFNGNDFFTYRVCDEGNPGLCDEARVDVGVAAVNDAPVARDDEAEVSENDSVGVEVLENDTDAEGGIVPASVTVTNQPENGTATPNADGTITYKPDADFFGTDDFEYTVSDGTAVSQPATVTIAVANANDAPVANDDTESVDEDTPEDIDVLFNDTDPDGKGDLDPASVTITAEPGEGTATPNDDGTVTYTPNANYNGPDSFTYEVCDKGATPQCDEATVDVQITPVSDDTIARPDFYEVNEDGVLNVAAPGVLENDEDPDGPLTAVVTRETYMGTLILYPDGSFTYTPNADFSGNDFFFYRANDTSPDGGSDETSVSINVLPLEEPAACNDGRDNDGDGKRDLRDPGCDNRRDDSERNSAPDNGGQPACTIKGSDRTNTLRGTANRDVICGRGGNDTIFGMGGNDLIFGNAGNDTIQGGAGDDTIYGGGGEDTIQGNDGNDRIYGGEKGDLLQGNDGRDTIRGNGGDDVIQGGAGDDDIDGGAGNDTTQQ